MLCKGLELSVAIDPLETLSGHQQGTASSKTPSDTRTFPRLGRVVGSNSIARGGRRRRGERPRGSQAGFRQELP